MICTVFAVTGSSTLYFVRPTLKRLGIEGSMMDGPNSYRLLSVMTVTPIYTVILITLGTLVGRHTFFASQGVRMLNRFGLNKRNIACQPAIQKANKVSQ